jgi:hypothetical protein
MILGKRIDQIEDETAVVSHNYYSEILFDYLTIFYTKIRYSLKSSDKVKSQLRRQARDDELDKGVYRKYCNYHKSILKRQQLMEK